MKLKKLEIIITDILKEDKNAQSDDFVLYYRVLQKLDINTKETLKTFLMRAKRLKMPIFESVSRVRRKIQKENPDLVDKITRIKRFENMKNYKNYNGGIEK